MAGELTFEILETQLTDDLETDLGLISQHSLRFFLAQQDAIRMLMFESVHFPEMRTALAQNPRGMIELLVRYFEKQRAEDKVQVVDPQVTAQAFMSMIFGYAIGMHPVSDLLPAEIPIEKMSAEFVRIFLATLKPNNQ